MSAQPDIASPRLVLWDIDHTLIESGEVARHAYAAAFHHATGLHLRQPWQFDGRTEIAAATEALQTHGFPADDELLGAFLDSLVAELRQRAAELTQAGRALPGAAEALATVHGLVGMHQSVLTGNLYPLAMLKLDSFGLTGFIDLRIGAYGGDAYERTSLPAHALRRAHEHLGWRFSGQDTAIVGDTRRDIQAAHAIGAKAIGVATGATSADQLLEAGADIVLADLTDTAAVIHAITT